MKTQNLILLLICFVFIGCYSCNYRIDHSFRQAYSNANMLIHKDSTVLPFFKIHFKNGNVSILEKWKLNDSKDSIIGEGKLYNFNRSQIYSGGLSFYMDEIAIIETNHLESVKSKDNARIAVLSILTGANIFLDLFCLSNPKACFGSCPTFYVDPDEDIHSANAEGFSSAIAPSLEKYDLDALQHSTSVNEFYLTMKNEAYETHMVNELALYAIEKNKKDNVFHDSNGQYYRCNKLFGFNESNILLNGNRDAANEVSSKLAKIDDQEYYSTTDSTDLTAKEEIIVEFDDLPKGDLGMVINFRQTLLTTFLLYSGISYMGDEAGEYFMKIETDTRIKNKLGSPFSRLGKIEFSVWDVKNKKWNLVDDLFETGPIAKNLVLIPILNEYQHTDHLKVKITMTKGLWRLDYFGLTSIEDIVEPIKILPSEIDVINGEPYTIEDIKADDKQYLLSFPGNEFRFKFDLPTLSDNSDYELFLSSKGYYLEWIRQSWIKGENHVKLRKMLMGDNKTWTELAIEFKTMEKEMESVFWNSKYPIIQ